MAANVATAEATKALATIVIQRSLQPTSGYVHFLTGLLKNIVDVLLELEPIKWA